MIFYLNANLLYHYFVRSSLRAILDGYISIDNQESDYQNKL